MRILLALKQRNYLNTFTRARGRAAPRGHAVQLAWPDEDVSRPEELPDSRRPVTIDVVEAEAGRRLGAARHHGASGVRLPALSGAGVPRRRQAARTRVRKAAALAVARRACAASRAGASRRWSCRPRSASACRRFRPDGRRDAERSGDTRRCLAANRPDVVLVSPLIDLGSAQTDIIKSARSGWAFPTGMLLFSWDNLSTKGSLHVPPDRMFVWNELQRQEAAELHGFPAGARRCRRRAALRRVLRARAGDRSRRRSARRSDFDPRQPDPDVPRLVEVRDRRPGAAVHRPVDRGDSRIGAIRALRQLQRPGAAASRREARRTTRAPSSRCDGSGLEGRAW